MYVEVVLRVKGGHYCPVVVNTAAQSMSGLLGAHNMTELNENFTVRVTNYNCTRQHTALNFNYFILVWSWNFNTNYVAKNFAFLD